MGHELISTTELTNGVGTSGTWVHSVNRNGLMTLYTMPKYIARTDNEVPANPDPDLFCVLHIGHREHMMKLSMDPKGGRICSDLPVFAQEECWIFVSHPNHIVYGNISV